MQQQDNRHNLNSSNTQELLSALLMRKQRPKVRIIFASVLILCIVGASIAILASSFFPDLFTKAHGSTGTIEAISGGTQSLNDNKQELDANPSALSQGLAKTPQGDKRAGLVHVLGAVKNPGVYPIKPKSRVVDVIQSAGGFLPNSDQSSVNLAEFVSDEDQIIVARIDQEDPNAENIGHGLKNKLININKASESELTQLPKIGSLTAKKIIQYRQKHGKFKSIDALANIPGIGPSLIAGIRDLAKV